MIGKPSSGRSDAFFAFVAIVLCITTIPLGQFVDAAYVVTVPAHDEECFVIGSPGPAGGTLHGDFDYLNDELSAEPVSVVVIDTTEQNVLYRSRRRANEGVFRVTLKPDQKVDLCLQNGIVTAGRGKKSRSARTHDGEDRIIGFQYDVEPKDSNKEVHNQNDRNRKAALELQRGIVNLLTHHNYMRVREGKHRDLVETTFNHLMLWVFMEAILVIAIAVMQILYFRNFLERRRYM